MKIHLATAVTMRAWITVAFAAATMSCAAIQKGDNFAQAEAARSALVEWFECEECTDGQLENVLKFGKQLQPMLIGALREGAAPASKELYRIELQRRYDELVAYSRTHPHARPTLPKDSFVARYMDNLDALYRTRAAQALSRIGSDDAKLALRKALEDAEREDVKRVIKESLQTSR